MEEQVIRLLKTLLKVIQVVIHHKVLLVVVVLVVVEQPLQEQGEAQVLQEEQEHQIKLQDLM